MYSFYKENPADKVWWCDEIDDENSSLIIGEYLFSFDKKTVFNLFRDYPWKLTLEEKQIFDKENPYWRDFFKERQ